MPGRFALEGRTLGKYRLLRGIGHGGMAEVYLAEDERLGRQVAIKILPTWLAQEGNFQARFDREARSAARLQHPHILAVHDYGQQENITYLVMPYITGGTLAHRIAQANGPLPLNLVVLWTSEMASALQFAHSQGIIHRDVKPGNMLLTEGDHIVLSDFGIAKVVTESSNLTLAGSTVGSPDYMSPEQANGEPDYRSDIYSLGVVIFQMLTGRLPFTASTPVQIMLLHVQAPPPALRSINPTLPAQVDAVMQRALAKKPIERYQSATELADALRTALQGAIPGPRPTLPAPDLSTRAEQLPAPTAAPPPGYTRPAVPPSQAVPASPAPTFRPPPTNPSPPQAAPTNRAALPYQPQAPARAPVYPTPPAPAQPQPARWNGPAPATQGYPGAYQPRPTAAPAPIPAPAPRPRKWPHRVLLLILALLLLVAAALSGVVWYLITHPGAHLFGLF